MNRKNNDRNKATVDVKSTGFFGVLTIVFVVLKLIKVINWSWVWVLSPLWIEFILVILIIIISLAIIKNKASK